LGLLVAMTLLVPAQADAQSTDERRMVPQGTAVRLSALREDSRYRDTFVREFGSLTPGTR